MTAINETKSSKNFRGLTNRINFRFTANGNYSSAKEMHVDVGIVEFLPGAVDTRPFNELDAFMEHNGRKYYAIFIMSEQNRFMNKEQAVDQNTLLSKAIAHQEFVFDKIKSGMSLSQVYEMSGGYQIEHEQSLMKNRGSNQTFVAKLLNNGMFFFLDEIWESGDEMIAYYAEKMPDNTLVIKKSDCESFEGLMQVGCHIVRKGARG